MPLDHGLCSSRPTALRRCALLVLAAAALPSAFASQFEPDSRERILNLSRETWRFSIGDDARWSEPAFDDHAWTRITVPSAWEDDGYDNYNGYAWYRCRFRFGANPDRPTYLVIGQIDDVDEVFVNGRKVGGAGQLPPNYLSAWDRDRIYPLPAGLLKEGKGNVIAVRVYDGGGDGGIRGDAVGIYTERLPVPLVELTGEWQFHPGDDLRWKEPETDVSGFTPIMVPAYWENVGHDNLDGFAWYRKTFAYPKRSDDATMVLMLGKIDDTDEVYLNGTKIGSTGTLTDADRHSGVGYYDENRGYFFPASLLRDSNVVAVRVHDHGGMGGIYRGPIGIISQSNYISYWESCRHEHRGQRAVRRFFRRLTDD